MLAVTFLRVRGVVCQCRGAERQLSGLVDDGRGRVQRLQAVGRFGTGRGCPMGMLGRRRFEGGVPRVALVIDLGDVASIRVDVVLDGLNTAVRQKDKVFPLGAVGVPALGVAEVCA